MVSGGLTERAHLNSVREAPDKKQRNICRYWLRNGQRVNRSLEKSEVVILEDLGCKIK